MIKVRNAFLYLVVLSASAIALLAGCGGTTEEAKVELVSLAPSDTTIAAGKKFMPRVHIDPPCRQKDPLYWQSSNEAVAVVFPTGEVLAMSDGEATISATAADGPKGELHLTVGYDVPASGIQVSPEVLRINVNKQAMFQAKVVPSVYDGEIKWSSADEKIASFANPKEGLITAHKAGETEITARINSYSSKAKVIVYNGPEEGKSSGK
ncbi:hypothetical protein HQ45_06885 [Porphyromonas crevioricanis]|uniref:BIG2 domain-containing protein n=1 Tax=Porphyromonas crevioricanis TaxID=393921 RepID=A0AB34PGK0_9PORP|nr:Ig-like domain-containing protein [Porphyromonas crevioricanis]KGN89702.1 hypothetical protein HQ45_06885 [Porphyromonas crevioricanis]KGN93760.1 hypothetical protein HQ38_08260 [Porphyromonas crevioricanis]